MISIEYCKICGGKEEHENGECISCREYPETVRRLDYFGKLRGLTLEERIHRIELWIYEHDQKVVDV